MTTPRHRRRSPSPEHHKATRLISTRDGRRTPAAAALEEPAREPYGTVDGDALVKRWLAQMDDDGRDRPRSRHGHRETRQTVDPGISVSRRKRDRSASLPPSPRQRSRSIHKDDTTHPRFEKRPRHKTREDRYEPRNGPPDHLDGRTVERRGQHRRRTEEPVRKRLASARDVIDNFASDSILNNRLTLQPATMPGLFQNGHASANKQPADLSYNSMNFLSRPRERKQPKQPKDTGKKEREVQELSAFFRGGKEPEHRRRSGGSPELQRRKSTPVPGRAEAGRINTSARSPVTTYLSWSPSAVGNNQTGSCRDTVHDHAEAHRSRRLAHTAENSVQARETHMHKPRHRREPSSPSPPRRIVRYKDKGVMTLETRMGTGTGPVAVRTLITDIPDGHGLGLDESRGKTMTPAHLDQPCQAEEAGLSVAKETDVDRPEENTPSPAELGITDSGRLLEPGQKNAVQDTKELPPPRSSSPEYLASLEKVVSGRTTSQGTRGMTRPVSQAENCEKASNQQRVANPANNNQQGVLPEAQENPRTTAPRRSEAWIADDEAFYAPQPGLTHDNGAVEACAHHQYGSHPSDPNPRHRYHQLGKADNLISRVDRELAKDAALSKLSYQLHREEEAYQIHAAPVLEEDDWMDEPYMNGHQDSTDVPGLQQNQWADEYAHPEQGQQETGPMSQFWQPNMFM